MKIFFTILFFTVLSANATIFYVSNAGSDAANGTSTGTSWLTIAKVNAQTFAAGDQILFKSGDSWNEKLNPPSSGTLANPIIFGSYGTGVKPTITGLQSVTGFTNTSGNIWSKTVSSSVANLNTVLIGGAIRAKGRYPNSSYLTTYGTSTTTTINTLLTGTPDYSGAELAIFSVSYICDVVKVISQSTSALNTYPVTYAPVHASQYFFQNRVDFLDLQNEWCFDSTTKLLSIYSVGAPSNVQVSTIDTLVNIYKKDFLTFDGINFTGANNVGLYLDTVRHNIIQNCTTNYMGGNNVGPTYISGVGGAAIMGRNAVGCTIQNDSILNSLNNGVSIFYDADTLLIYNNYIKNSGFMAGMCAGSNGAGMGIFHFGKNSKIYNNRIDSSGYAAMFFGGNFDTVKYNFVTNFCFIKDDGGGIYTYPGAVDSYDTSVLIRLNIVGNGIGAGKINVANGIYLDDNTNKVTVDSNTVYNCNYAGIFLHNNNKITVNDNTIVNSIGDCFRQIGSSSSGGTTGSVSYYQRNIFYSTLSTKYTLNYGYQPANTVMDYNYYLRPVSETNKIFNTITGLSYSSVAAWSAVYGFETHGSDTPTGITGQGTLYYNATMSASTVPLSGRYIDAKGVAYNGSITLQPFQSSVLFYSSTQLPKGYGNLIFQ